MSANTIIMGLGGVIFTTQGILGLFMPQRVVAYERAVSRRLFGRTITTDPSAPAERAVAAFSLLVGLLLFYAFFSE